MVRSGHASQTAARCDQFTASGKTPRRRKRLAADFAAARLNAANVPERQQNPLMH